MFGGEINTLEYGSSLSCVHTWVMSKIPKEHKTLAATNYFLIWKKFYKFEKKFIKRDIERTWSQKSSQLDNDRGFGGPDWYILCIGKPPPKIWFDDQDFAETNSCNQFTWTRKMLGFQSFLVINLLSLHYITVLSVPFQYYPTIWRQNKKKTWDFYEKRIKLLISL